MIFILPPGAKTRHFDACHEAGVSFCLAKPVTPSDLMDAVLRVHGQAPEKTNQGDREGYVFSETAPSLRVLLAEDNPVNQKLARRVLEKMGHKVTTVSNGIAAVDTLQKGDYDVVLMDVQMPVMDGLTATGRIRAFEKGKSRHIPIIAMTANAMEGDRERCLAAGMDDYLSKPMRFQDLAEALSRNTGRSEKKTMDQEK